MTNKKSNARKHQPVAAAPLPTPAAESAFSRRERERRDERARLLDAHAHERDTYRKRNGYYYEQIDRIAEFYVPKGASVLEIGCSTGELLARLQPSRGVGIDLSPKVIEIAQGKFPGLEFRVGDAETLDLGGETFDYVVMSDVVGYLDDVWAALRALRKVMRPDSRLLLTHYNFLWEPLLQLGSRVGRKMPVEEQNWLGGSDLQNLMKLNGLEVVNSGSSTLLPIAVPVVATLANRLLAKIPAVRDLNLIEYFVAKPTWQHAGPPTELSCTVVVPCRNEAGNVEDIFARTPELGKGTELIFVDGNSSDGTIEEIEKRLASRPGTRLIHQGDGKGKGDAVRKGFAAATGDVLFILDADLTVPPEDLPKFFDAIAEGHGDYINGSRLVYPMEGGAMRLLNLFGNKFFSMAFTHALGIQVKDTLCGTKVLTKKNYEKIAEARVFFGDFDPFGDFDLLFGAAHSSLKLVEVPIRYRARTYGETKIDRFRHGWLLLRMTALAYRKFQLSL